MTWMLLSWSIKRVRSPSLPDPLHVAVDRDLANLGDLAVLDQDQPRAVGRPMVLARERERRRDAPRVEVLQRLERLLHGLARGIGAGALDRLHGQDGVKPAAPVGRGMD